MYNVAGAATRRTVPLANQILAGFDSRTRASFADTVRSIAERLGCDPRLIDRS